MNIDMRTVSTEPKSTIEYSKSSSTLLAKCRAKYRAAALG